MRARYWVLLIGGVLALVGLYDNGLPFWRDWCLLFGGGLIGLWAFEGVRDRVEQHGGRVDPL